MKRAVLGFAAIALGIGVAVSLFAALNGVAALANRVHFSGGYHPTIGHPLRLVPGRTRLAAAPSDHPRFRVDADGWRQDGRAEARVALFGGSAAFGFYVDDADTIAHALGARNVAQVGYALRDELLVLRDLIEGQRAPAVAIFYDGANERGHRGGYSRVDEPYTRVDYGADDLAIARDAYGRVVNVEHLPVLAFARRLWRPTTATAHAQDRAAIEAHAEAAAEVYAVNQRLVRAMAEAAGIRAVFVLQPLAACLTPVPTHIAYPVPEADRIYYPLLYAAIKRRAAVDADLCACMPGEAFKTPVHLNGAGNRMVAGRLSHLVK